MGNGSVHAPAGRRAARLAFTLVEMLVVVTILGLLLSILLPALQKAKEHAYDGKCRANLSHLHKLMHSTPPSAGKSTGFSSALEWTGVVGQTTGLLNCPKDEGGGAAPSMTGAVTMIPPPPSVEFNELESNTVIHGFIEREAFELPSAVAVNINKPGRYGGSSLGCYTGIADKIPTGTAVDCYYLVFDPVGSQSASASGTIVFGSRIYGMVVRTAELEASDPILGKEDIIYPVNVAARGYEVAAEEVEILPDRCTLKIRSYWSTWRGEHARILTEQGGLSSYGMNDEVNPSDRRPGQLLLVEYKSTVVHTDSERHAGLLRPRHFDHANVVYTDGSVAARTPEQLTPDNDDWRPARGR